MKRILSFGLAIAFSASINLRPAQANPAAVAPLALCGTGVGCVLVGAVVVAGATYYLWEYGGGKQVIANASGVVLKMIDDPEDDSLGEMVHPLPKPAQQDEVKARQYCRRAAGGRSYRIERVGGKFVCFVSM